MLEITAWSVSRDVAIKWLEAEGLATVTPDRTIIGKECQIYPSRPDEVFTVVATAAVMKGMEVVSPAEIVPGWHFDLRIWGEAEARWRKANPAPALAPVEAVAKTVEEKQAPTDVKAVLDASVDLEGLEARHKVAPVFVEQAVGEKVPSGYEIEGVRFFPVSAIRTRRHGWQ